jgi:hypothetical protein
MLVPGVGQCFALPPRGPPVARRCCRCRQVRPPVPPAVPPAAPADAVFARGAVDGLKALVDLTSRCGFDSRSARYCVSSPRASSSCIAADSSISRTLATLPPACSAGSAPTAHVGRHLHRPRSARWPRQPGAVSSRHFRAGEAPTPAASSSPSARARLRVPPAGSAAVARDPHWRVLVAQPCELPPQRLPSLRGVADARRRVRSRRRRASRSARCAERRSSAWCACWPWMSMRYSPSCVQSCSVAGRPLM